MIKTILLSIVVFCVIAFLELFTIGLLVNFNIVKFELITWTLYVIIAPGFEESFKLLFKNKRNLVLGFVVVEALAYVLTSKNPLHLLIMARILTCIMHIGTFEIISDTTRSWYFNFIIAFTIHAGYNAIFLGV